MAITAVVKKTGKKIKYKEYSDPDLKKIRDARRVIKNYKNKDKWRRAARNAAMRMAVGKALTRGQNYVLGTAILRTKNKEKRRAMANNIAFMGGYTSASRGRKAIEKAWGNARNVAYRILELAKIKY